MSKKTPYIALLFANALVYALNALYYNFLPIYLQHGGKSDDEIGYLLAAAQLISVVAPFFWGVVTDKAKYKNNVLIFLVACASACFVAICLGNSLVYLFIMIPLVMLFQNNYGGLVDTITVEASNKFSWKYGILRVMGTFGFGLIAMGLAPFIKGDNIILVFVVYPIVGIVSMLALHFAPKIEGHASKKEKISLKPLFKNRTMMMIFVVLSVALLTFNYYQNFYAKYIILPIEEGGLGIPEWIMGTNVFVTVMGEIVFFAFYNFLMEKVGVKVLLWISVLIGTVRYMLLALASDALSIILVALLTGHIPTVVTYCATYYMMRTVAPNMRASGQMAMYALCSALPRVVGCAVGGELTQAIGTPGGLMVCAVLNFLTFIPLLFIPKKIYNDETPCA